MAKTAGKAGKAKAAKLPKTKAPAAPDAKIKDAKMKDAKIKDAKAKADADGDLRGASTSPITFGTLGTVEARLIGDQLRGLAYLSKKLALAIREKNLPTPFDPAELEAIGEQFYGMANAELRLAGDDGSNGG